MSKFINMIDFHAIIATYRLDISESMKNATNADINRNYNGCGADWMPYWSRTVLDEVVKLFRGAVGGHDWDFSESDGTKKNFNLANQRFLKNMNKIINYHYSWWNPFDYPERIKWWLKARALYRAVDFFGWKAWRDAYYLNQNLNKIS